MAEQALRHWGPSHGGRITKNQNVGIILKRHGLEVVQYVQNVARSMNETIPFYRDVGIAETVLETIGLNVLAIQEMVTEIAAPDNPKEIPVNTTPADLDAEIRFVKFTMPTIIGTSHTITVTARSTAMTSAETGLVSDFLMASIGKLCTTDAMTFAAKTYATAVNFEITLDVAYKFLGMNEGADPTDPNIVTFSFAKYVAATGEGGDFTLHPLSILDDTDGHDLYEVDQVAEFGTAGDDAQDALWGQLVAGTSAYLLSRTRTLNAEAPAEESIDVTVFPTGNPTA